MNRTCSIDGVWLPVDMNGCALSTCPEEGVWPETEPGVSGVVRDCGEGFIGTMTRDCSPIGQWEPVDDSLCSKYLFGHPIFTDRILAISISIYIYLYLSIE